jgi:exodeoxyribonuclease VII large subunit
MSKSTGSGVSQLPLFGGQTGLPSQSTRATPPPSAASALTKPASRSTPKRPATARRRPAKETAPRRAGSRGAAGRTEASSRAGEVLTVARLDRLIKRVLEGSTADVRVRGEVSGLHRAGSGHLYFIFMAPF